MRPMGLPTRFFLGAGRGSLQSLCSISRVSGTGDLLDVGSGTGSMAQAMAARWPTLNDSTRPAMRIISAIKKPGPAAPGHEWVVFPHERNCITLNTLQKLPHQDPNRDRSIGVSK